MKKILILLIPLLLTGCLGKEAKGYLGTVCTKTENSKEIKEVITYQLNFKENIISDITLTKEYNNDIVLSTLKSEAKSYNYVSGMSVDVNETNPYKITYKFNMSSLTDEEIINKFNLGINYKDLADSLESNGFTCK